MKLVIIFGPPAVGKMTVGKALAEKTGLKLFHNHMTIEVVLPFFDFGTDAYERLVTLFRMEIFREVAKSDLPGLIFTFCWAFNLDSEEAYVNEICQIFESQGGTVYFVELYAEQAQRLIRNRHPDRLAAKPSKRNLEHSEQVLLSEDENYRFNSLDGEFSRTNHLKIDNTNLRPDEVVDYICEHWNWS